MVYSLEPAFAWLLWIPMGCFAVGWVLGAWGIMRLNTHLPFDIRSRTLDKQMDVAWALLARAIGRDPALRTESNLLFVGFGLLFGSGLFMMLVVPFVATSAIN